MEFLKAKNPCIKRQSKSDSLWALVMDIGYPKFGFLVYSREILRRLIISLVTKLDFSGTTRLITKMCITNAYVYELSSAIGLSSYFKTEIEIYTRKNAMQSYFIPSLLPLCVGFLKFFFTSEASSIEKM